MKRVVPLEQVVAGIGAAVGGRHPCPARDLGVLARRHERVEIRVAPGAQRRRAVDQRLGREHDPAGDALAPANAPHQGARLSARSVSARSSEGTSRRGILLLQPALGLEAPPERAQAALAVLDGEVLERVAPAGVLPALREVEALSVRLERVGELLDAGRWRHGGDRADLGIARGEREQRRPADRTWRGWQRCRDRSS